MQKKKTLCGALVASIRMPWLLVRTPAVLVLLFVHMRRLDTRLPCRFRTTRAYGV